MTRGLQCRRPAALTSPLTWDSFSSKQRPRTKHSDAKNDRCWGILGLEISAFVSTCVLRSRCFEKWYRLLVPLDLHERSEHPSRVPLSQHLREAPSQAPCYVVTVTIRNKVSRALTHFHVEPVYANPHLTLFSRSQAESLQRSSHTSFPSFHVPTL